MHVPQPLTLAAAAILGFYATGGVVIVGLARALLTDRRGIRCGQYH